MKKKGYLILENKRIFEGESFGFPMDTAGEVVFNTGMTGYPESFTDPSYKGQILTLTYPLIGNYGVPQRKTVDGLTEIFESDNIQISGLIVSSYVENDNHWQAKTNLSHWLFQNRIPGICNIDTRSLTKIIRETGVMKGIITFKNPSQGKFSNSRQEPGISFVDIDSLNLVDQVSCKEPIVYGNGKIRIMMIDCGLKYNQIRLLLKQDTAVIRVPWNYDIFNQDNPYKFDALMVSNGPGDPKKVKETIKNIKTALSKEIPVFGICLGNQILALAGGADTYKLKYGHRGQNQPVQDKITGKCFITTQNHGFAVDTNSLPVGWEPWFTNLNDKTNEGIRHIKYPFFSCQFHPESYPGPVDTEWIFKYFISRVKEWTKKN